jgi:hypothetical protein
VLRIAAPIATPRGRLRRVGWVAAGLTAAGLVAAAAAASAGWISVEPWMLVP